MKNKNLFPSFVLIICVVFISSCNKQTPATPTPKYVFLFIGDGMGFAHVAAAEAYLSATKSTKPGNTSVSFTQFPVLGIATTYSANSYITCSSAAGTALSTGTKTNNGMLGIAPDGHPLRSVTYDLKKAGYKIGIATSVSIDHATPAAFYANDSSRNNYYSIACQLAPTAFDFFAGAGFLSPRGKDNTEKNVYEQVQQAGYVVVRTPEQLKQVNFSQKVIVMQEENRKQDALTQAFVRTGDDGWMLPDITKVGINLLDNPKGFFFMVEGGQIDWAAHSNDAAAVIYEVIDFSKAVEEAIAFYQKHPDETLIIVTADHETGGLTLGFRDIPYVLNPALIDEQKGKTLTKEEMKNLNERAGFGWTTGAHTGAAVPVFAIGAGSELFNGKMDNTDIPKKILKLMN